MYQETLVASAEVDEGQRLADIRRGQRDLVTLLYMARRLRGVLSQLDASDVARQPRPLIYELVEKHEGMHRLALYRPGELLTRKPLSFVGFISSTRHHLRPAIINAIQRSDRRLVEEIAQTPGLLSYTSLELRHGHWCNFVLFNDASIQSHLASNPTHQLAAHQLAGSYYAWIRLHHGCLPLGLAVPEFQLHHSRYYRFRAGQERPTKREIVYEAAEQMINQNGDRERSIYSAESS